MAYLIVWDLLPPFRDVESIFRGIVDLGKVFLFFAGGKGRTCRDFGRKRHIHSQHSLTAKDSKVTPQSTPRNPGSMNSPADA
jgi:hypothetical protein